MISVIIATRNGSQTLPRVLESLIQAALKKCNYEVIVVDNASNDNTAAVLQKYRESIPLRVLTEPRPGKNHALKRAVTVASGDLLIFTDDDVCLPVNFIRDYENVAREHPEHSIFGGHIVARWETVPDAGILAEIPLAHAYAITDESRAEGKIKAGRIFGPNMAIRKSVFEGGLAFDEKIGPNGGIYVMGDETDLLQRAEAAGYKAWFATNITVEHMITDEQIRLPWIKLRAELSGRSMLHESIRTKGRLPDARLLLGFPRWAVGSFVVAKIRSWYLQLVPKKKGFYASYWDAAFTRGYLVEYSRLLRLEKAGDKKVI